MIQMKKPKSVSIYGSDRFRPVRFLPETMDEDA